MPTVSPYTKSKGKRRSKVRLTDPVYEALWIFFRDKGKNKKIDILWSFAPTPENVRRFALARWMNLYYWGIDAAKKKGPKIREKVRAKLRKDPARDIVATCAALTAGVFPPNTIDTIWSKLIDEKFDQGRFNWALHIHENPSHVFAKAIAECLVAYIDMAGKPGSHPAWDFYFDLIDRAAFETLTNYALDRGLDMDKVSKMIEEDELFDGWQGETILHLAGRRARLAKRELGDVVTQLGGIVRKDPDDDED